MVLEALEVTNGDADGQLTVTMKGDPAKVMQVLVNGLPREGLEQLRDELNAEMARRGLPERV